MLVFVCDGNPGHEWQKLLGDHVRLYQRGNNLVRDPAGNLPVLGDILISHRIQDPVIRQRLEGFSVAGVVVVEVGTDSSESKLPASNYYRRARGVTKVDPHFAACFGCFREDLASRGYPTWALLEGPPPPDALLAYHLLGLLQGDPDAATERRRLAEYATKEARTMAEATGIDSLDNLDDAEARRRFLKNWR